MKIKTVTGPTIQAALAEARQQLGDNVLLLESVPAEGDRPASIKVVVDPSPSAPIAKHAPEPQVVEPVGFGYAAQRRTAGANAAPHHPETLTQPRSAAEFAASRVTNAPAGGHPRTGAEDPRTGPAHAQQAPSPAVKPAPRVAAKRGAASPDQASVRQELQVVQKRLQQLEKAMTRTAASPVAWRSIPLLRHMESLGLRESSLKRLFERVQSFQAQTGIRESESVLIRNELRRMLQMPVLRPAPPALLLMGAAGSGKTSLLLKLALHEEYFGRRRAAAIVVRPDEALKGLLNPVDLYRQSGIPVQTVSSREEMRLALERVERFDHVLVDTPSLPVAPEAAAAFAEKIQHIVQDLVPLHVQLVLDATRRIADTSLVAWSKLSLRPASAAITRLDESHEPGHFAEWLIRLQLPYGYASSGPAVPTDLSALSASGIAEQLTTPSATR